IRKRQVFRATNHEQASIGYSLGDRVAAGALHAFEREVARDRRDTSAGCLDHRIGTASRAAVQKGTGLPLVFPHKIHSAAIGALPVVQPVGTSGTEFAVVVRALMRM